MPTWDEGVLKFHDEYVQDIITAQGSGHNHQAWLGGYQDHIIQCLLMAQDQWHLLNSYQVSGFDLPTQRYKPDFSLEDACLVLYFHDIEKIWKYGSNSRRLAQGGYLNKRLVAVENKNVWFLGILPYRYGVHLEERHLHAIDYIHGEMDYSKTERKMSPLAAFCHCIDIMSARMFFDVQRLIRIDDKDE